MRQVLGVEPDGSSPGLAAVPDRPVGRSMGRVPPLMFVHHWDAIAELNARCCCCYSCICICTATVAAAVAAVTAAAHGGGGGGGYWWYFVVLLCSVDLWGRSSLLIHFQLAWGRFFWLAQTVCSKKIQDLLARKRFERSKGHLDIRY